MWAKRNVPILAILLSGLKMMFVALMMSLELITRVESVYTDVYNFPMMGTVQYHSKTIKDELKARVTYGSVTVVNSKFVLCASENMFQFDIDSGGQKFVFEGVSTKSLKVVVGSDIMLPPNDDYEKDKVQVVDVLDVIFGESSAFLLDISRDKTDWDIFRRKHRSLILSTHGIKAQDLKDLRDGVYSKTYRFNPFRELQWDVSILSVEPLSWSKYVLPIPFHWADDKKINEQYADFWDEISAVEKNPHRFVPCSVPGWSTIGNNEIVYHRVVYVRFKNCEEAICGAYPSTCLRYLNVRQHVCFKSLSFADSCVLDQGAPVLCNWATDPKNNPLFLGILVRAFECGSQGLPLVFTRAYAIDAFASIIIRKEEDKPAPALIDPKYEEKAIE